MRGLAIPICCLGLSTFAWSSVKVEKIVPHECTQLLRIAVTLDGKPVPRALVSVRLGFSPADDPNSFSATNDDGIASLPKLAPRDYRADIYFNGIRSEIFDEPVTTTLYLRVVPKLEVSTVPVDIGKSVRELWRADESFDRQLKEAASRQLAATAGRPLGDQLGTFRETVADPTGANVASVKTRIVQMAPRGWELVFLGATDVKGQLSGQLHLGRYIAICSSPGFRTVIVPFDVRQDGSQLRVVLQIAEATQ